MRFGGGVFKAAFQMLSARRNNFRFVEIVDPEFWKREITVRFPIHWQAVLGIGRKTEMVRKARPTLAEDLADRLIERSELYMQAQLQRRREMWMRMRVMHR